MLGTYLCYVCCLKTIKIILTALNFIIHSIFPSSLPRCTCVISNEPRLSGIWDRPLQSQVTNSSKWTSNIHIPQANMLAGFQPLGNISNNCRFHRWFSFVVSVWFFTFILGTSLAASLFHFWFSDFLTVSDAPPFALFIFCRARPREKRETRSSVSRVEAFSMVVKLTCPELCVLKYFHNNYGKVRVLNSQLQSNYKIGLLRGHIFKKKLIKRNLQPF